MIAHDYKYRVSKPNDFNAGALRGAALVLLMLVIAVAALEALA